MKKIFKKPDFTKLTSFGCNAIGMILSIVVAFAFSIPFGLGYAIDWVTDLILYTVIIEVALDFVGKLRAGGVRFCWEYFVGITLTLFADWAFMFAAHQTETIPFFEWLAVLAVLAIGASVWFAIPVKKKYAKKGA